MKGSTKVNLPTDSASHCARTTLDLISHRPKSIEISLHEHGIGLGKPQWPHA